MKRLLLLTLSLCLLPAASASAAVRYAAPGGGAEGPCAQTVPCSLATAITGAGAGDEVVVEPGTYEAATAIEATVPLTIRGVSAWSSTEYRQIRPRIVGAAGVVPMRTSQPTTIANLTIESSGGAEASLFADANGDAFDHLELTATGSGPLALRAGVDWTLTDSLLVAKGEPAGGIFVEGLAPGTATMRNDTVIAEGSGSTGVAVAAAAPVAVTIDAVNSIVIAPTGASTEGSPGSSPSLVFDHSYLSSSRGTVTATAAEGSAPLFRAPATGDFREAPGSPTIDAGVNDPADGTTDLDGEPRTMGPITCGPTNPPAITDIGAFEYASPAPPCVPIIVRPPKVRITKVAIHGRSVTFRFASSALSAHGFACKLDQGPWLKCASPKTYKRLALGRHTFQVRPAGAGVARTPALRRFKVSARPHPRGHRPRGGPAAGRH